MPRNHRTWVVIADGAHARIVTRGNGDPGYAIVTEFDSADAHHRARDIGSDHPGRSQESAYSGRHAIEPRTDPHEAQKTKFIGMVASYLNDRDANGEYDALILFAPPHCLHDLRESLNATTKSKVKHQAPQDLTKLPLAALPQHLENMRWD